MCITFRYNKDNSMLSVKHRFHGHNSLRYVYKNGQALRSHLVTIKYVTNRYRQHPRFAVVISKKIHKSAVRRNRIRRRIYEIVRHELPYLNGTYDVVLIVSSGELLALPFTELHQTIQQLFKQANLYK